MAMHDVFAAAMLIGKSRQPSQTTGKPNRRKDLRNETLTGAIGPKRGTMLL